MRAIIQSKLKKPLPIIPNKTHQLQEINQQLRNAKEEYRQMLKEAPERRDQHLWDQAYAAEISGNKKASKEIKQLRFIEQTRRTQQKITYYFKDTLDCSMDHIEVEHVTNGITTKRIIRDQEEMKLSIIKHNQKHF